MTQSRRFQGLVNAEFDVWLMGVEYWPLRGLCRRPTFAGKINMSFTLNIYDKLARDELLLHNIRAIRNRFAHHLEVRDFDHPEVAGKCDNLNGPTYIYRRPTQEPRTRREIAVPTQWRISPHDLI
jgi:hypothetical protein